MLEPAPVVGRVGKLAGMEPGALTIAVDDPRNAEVRSLVETHLAFARGVTPICQVHALDADALSSPDIIVFSARQGRKLVGVGALKQLDDQHGEIKSMHISDAARGQGVGRALLGHLVAVAGERGYSRLSLETGTMPEFEPARALYRSAGFEECEPFGSYTAEEGSVCMALTIRSEAR